jgi:hypothetical protein
MSASFSHLGATAQRAAMAPAGSVASQLLLFGGEGGGAASSALAAALSTSYSAAHISTTFAAFAEWARNSLDVVRPYAVELSYALLLQSYLELLLMADADAAGGGGGGSGSASAGGGGGRKAASSSSSAAATAAHGATTAPVDAARALVEAHRHLYPSAGQQADLSALLVVTDPTAQLFHGLPPSNRRGRLDALRGVGGAAADTDTSILARLADPQTRTRVVVTPLTVQLAVEYLLRSAAPFLLGRLNERVTVIVSDDPQNALPVPGPAASGVPLPIADVTAGVARAAERISAADAPAQGGPSTTRGSRGQQVHPDVLAAAAARVVQWGAPSAGPGTFVSNAPQVLQSIPWPDYRAHAYGRAVLSGAAEATTTAAAAAAAAAAGDGEDDASMAGEGATQSLPSVRTTVVADAGPALAALAAGFGPRPAGLRANTALASAVVAGFVDGTVRLWVTMTTTAGPGAGSSTTICCQSAPSTAAASTAATSAAVSPCLQYALTGHADGSVRLWHVGQRVAAADSNGRAGAASSSSSSSSLSSIGSNNNNVELLSPLAVYPGHGGLPVLALAFAPFSSSIFASGGRDGCAYLWSTAFAEPQRAFAGHSGDVTSVAFHPNGLYILTGSADRSARLWEAATGDCLRAFAGHGARVTAVAPSPGGRFVATGSADGGVHVWNVATGVAAASWRVAAGAGSGSSPPPVHTIAFSPDGKTVCAAAPSGKGGAGSSLCLWDLVPAVADHDKSVGASGVPSGTGRKRGAAARAADTAALATGGGAGGGGKGGADIIGVLRLPEGPARIHALAFVSGARGRELRVVGDGGAV